MCKNFSGTLLLPDIAPSKNFPERFLRPGYFAIHWATSEAKKSSISAAAPVFMPGWCSPWAPPA